MYATNLYQNQFELSIKKENEQFKVDLQNNFLKINIITDEIISVIIDMSCQSDGIIKFSKSDYIKIIDKPVQIYLHRIDTIEKCLEPIILTNENKYKLYRIISSLKFDGYTEQSVLDEWLIKNNINQYVYYY